MNYRKVGIGMIIIALILAICVVLMIQPLTELSIGLLSLVFFVYATGLAFTTYGESTSKQQENHREIMVRLESLEEQIQKGFNEPKGTQSTIVPTLQAFSQLYLDYLAKQQSGEAQESDSKDMKGPKEAQNDQG